MSGGERVMTAGEKTDPIQLQSSACCLPFIAITIGTLEETWKNRRDPI
jgi:hypothetical protein